MNLFEKYKLMVEGKSTLYGEGNKYTSRVYQNKDGSHVAKFFRDGVHMELADYQHKDQKEVHEFAKEEIARRKSENVTERILEPQGHKETPDPITKDSERGHGNVKKMMGNRSPLEIISKILAGR